MGGRVSGIEGVPGNPCVLYAAMGSGGLFKTTNGGITWQASLVSRNHPNAMFLQKPFTSGRLVETVKAAIAR
jgi:hypothetical protein